MFSEHYAGHWSYDEGQGVPKDLGRAEDLLDTASQGGALVAIQNLGTVYARQGDGHLRSACDAISLSGSIKSLSKMSMFARCTYRGSQYLLTSFSVWSARASASGVFKGGAHRLRTFPMLSRA